MMRWLHFGLLIIPGLCGSAQWTVPTSVVLDGASGAERQVQGLGEPAGGTHGASLLADRTSATTFATASGIDALALTLVPAPAAYAPGMRIIFIPTTANTGDATLNANGIGAVPLRKNVNVPLDSGDFHPGVPVQVVHDGAVFQVTSQLYPGCPVGYVPVGSSTCVEAESHGPTNWFNAAGTCVNQGKRLCGFAEWIQACSQSTGSIFGSISDYEWVDEAANSVNDAKTMGINATTLLPDCRSGGTRGPLEMMRYRCCYDR